MRTVIQISALVESTSTDDMVEASVSLSADNGQITVEVPEWETRFEVPADHLRKALEALNPTEPAASPVTLTMVQSLGQKLSKLEQQIAAIPNQRLELEALGENLEALRREVQARLMVAEGRLEGLENHQITHNAQIAALQGEERENDAAIVALENMAQNFGDRIAVLENNLAEPPAEVASMALYGGEQ